MIVSTATQPGWLKLLTVGLRKAGRLCNKRGQVLLLQVHFQAHLAFRLQRAPQEQGERFDLSAVSRRPSTRRG